MRAILQSGNGAADTLYLGEMDMPQPAAGQLLVKVAAAGVNRADIVQREGRYPPPAGAPCTLGLEVAGSVVALGEGVQGFSIGDAVFGLVAGGGYAEYALLDQQMAIAKPVGWTWVEAAAVPEVWLTAWFKLVEQAQLQAGETVLIHAGASGVGAASIQLARWLGANAWTTAGSTEKVAFCRELGAQQAWNYHDVDFAVQAKAAGGVDVILDCVGGAYLERNLACLKPDGRLVIIGLMGGAQANLNLGLLLVKRLMVKGSTLRSQPLAVKSRLNEALSKRLMPAMLAGDLRTPLAQVFDWQEVAIAHCFVEENRNLGKVVLQIS